MGEQFDNITMTQDDGIVELRIHHHGGRPNGRYGVDCTRNWASLSRKSRLIPTLACC